MLQIMLKGRIVDFQVGATRPGSKPRSTLAVEVSAYRMGERVRQVYLCTFNEYWTERLQKLDEKTKYITVRGSDVVASHELGKDDLVHNYIWISGEEFFL